VGCARLADWRAIRTRCAPHGLCFSFCTDNLGFTKAAAFRRTTAARLLARFPLVADYLVDGRLNLTTLVELRDVLDESHLVEILDRAAGRTEDQVKQLVAELRPQPAPADLLRRLPTHRNHSSGSGPELAASSAPVVAMPPSSSSAPLAAVLPSPATSTVTAPRPPTTPATVSDASTVEATQELVDLIHAVGQGRLELILSATHAFEGNMMRYDATHTYHLHVRLRR
jgi:hypothetical protein